jgi:hypothetical protein
LVMHLAWKLQHIITMIALSPGSWWKNVSDHWTLGIQGHSCLQQQNEEDG